MRNSLREFVDADDLYPAADIAAMAAGIALTDRPSWLDELGRREIVAKLLLP